MEKVQNFIFPNAAPQDGVSWWMKYAGKAGGIIGGIGEPDKNRNSDPFYIVTYYI